MSLSLPTTNYNNRDQLGFVKPGLHLQASAAIGTQAQQHSGSRQDFQTADPGVERPAGVQAGAGSLLFAHHEE